MSNQCVKNFRRQRLTFGSCFVYDFRMWTEPEPKGLSILTGAEDEQLQVVSDGCDTALVSNQLHKHI